MTNGKAYLTFEEPEVVFDLTSIGLLGEIIKTKNQLILMFDEGIIDLLKIDWNSCPEILKTNESFDIIQQDFETQEIIRYTAPKNSKVFQELLITLLNF